MSTDEHTVVGILSDVDILRNVEIPRNIPETIEAIMTKKVKTCSPEERVSKVWGHMLETNYTGVPVVSNGGEPIGMITRRDIIKSGAVRSSLEDVMSTPTYTLSESDSVQSAIEMIIHYDIGRVTIVNGNVKISGIIDRQDLLESIVNAWTE
jgi:CBS domain-containing protein